MQQQYQNHDEDLPISYSYLSVWNIRNVTNISISSNSEYIVLVSKLSQQQSQLSLFQIKQNEEQIQFIQLWQVELSIYCLYILFYKNNRQFIVGSTNSIDFFQITNNQTAIQTQTIQENCNCLKLLLIENDQSLVIINENFFSIWRNNDTIIHSTKNYQQWQSLITRLQLSAVCLSKSEEQIVLSYFNKRIILLKKTKNHKWMIAKKIKLHNKKISSSFVNFLDESSILLKQDLISLNQWKNKIIRKIKITGAEGKVIDFNNHLKLGFFIQKQSIIIRQFISNNFNKIKQKIEFNDKIRDLALSLNGNLLFVFLAQSAQLYHLDVQSM